MMDGGVMPYDSRPVTSEPLHRPVVAPQFFAGTTSYSQAPMTTMGPTTYHPHVPFTTYGHYASSPLPSSIPSSLPSPLASSPLPSSLPPSLPSSLGTAASSLKHQESARPPQPQQPPVPLVKPDAGSNSGSGTFGFVSSRRVSYVDGSRSPSARSDGQLSSTKSVSSNLSTMSRNITTNVPVNGSAQADFNTCVDALMKTIQAKSGSDALPNRAEAEQVIQQERILGSPEQEPQLHGKENKKRFYCDIPGCPKSFFQKTHLDIHRRAHTGDKPYTCKLPGCGRQFSQLGNLRTHERRHTGERPYVCDQCGKRFAQRGNVRAHLKTHQQGKPFQCKLDGCNKNFTQLGNLKSHQNKFHMETLRSLTARFAGLEDYGSVSQVDQELLEYFATLYKNSNKGIKGRGKDRRVAQGTSPIRLGAMISSPVPTTNRPNQRHRQRPPPPGPPTPSPQHHDHKHGLSTSQGPQHSPHPHAQQQQPQHQHQHHQHPHPPPQLPHPRLSRPAAYGANGRPNVLNVGVSASVSGTAPAAGPGRHDGHAGYVFAVEDGGGGGGGGATAPAASASTGDTSYDDDQNRDLAFGERMY